MFRFAFALALALLFAINTTTAAAPATSTPLARDSVYQLPLRLTDQHGKSWDWRTRRGRPQVVAMFYTTCQYICPLIVDSGKAVDRALSPAERGRIGVLLISMDPERDTPAALMSVVRQRGLDSARWSLASPKAADPGSSPGQAVRSVAGILGVRYRRLDDGEFNHTSALVLLDAEGRVLARTEQVGSRPDPDFVAAVRRALAAPSAGSRASQPSSPGKRRAPGFRSDRQGQQAPGAAFGLTRAIRMTPTG